MSQILPISPALPWLAPLAGYSDLAFRLLCRELGAAVCCTEMVSAKGLAHNGPGSNILLKTCPQDQPLVLQLFGAEGKTVDLAMLRLLELGFNWFDLNAGCPVPKVTRTGCGAAMLKDPEHLLSIVKIMRKRAGSGKVGVKIRLGWDKPIFLELALKLEEVGIDWLTLHPRLGCQGFRGQADWQAIAKLRQKISLPVIASGDLHSAQDAIDCLSISKASGVMFARGAMRNPAIFQNFIRLQNKSASVKLDDETAPAKKLGLIIRRHIELARRHGSSIMLMRSFIPRYVKNMNMAKAMRKELVKQDNWEGLLGLVDKHLPY